MSSAKPTSPAVNETVPAPPQLFRFSLLTLLSVTTLAGVVSSIVFSPHWDTDERLLLAFWCAGLILGVSVGRFCGTSGILSGGLGAVVGCLAAAAGLLGKSSHTGKWHAWEHNSVGPYFAFVVCVSWFAAVFAAWIYRAVCAGACERLWYNARVRRILLVLMGSVPCAMIGWQLLQERRWKPAWEVDLKVDKFHRVRTFQTSSGGDRLFASVEANSFHANTSTDYLFRYTPRGVVRQKLSESIDQPHLALSPDGKWLAAGTSVYLSVFDLTGSTNPTVWKLKDIESFSQLQFNAAGELLVTTHTPRIQRCYTIDVTSDPLPQPLLFPFAGRLHLDPTGDVILQLHEAVEENGNWSIDIIRRSDGESLGQIADVPEPRSFAISPGGLYVAIDNRVWKLGGKSQALAGRVTGFTADQRAIVLFQQLGATPHTWTPHWLVAMPFARHLFTGKMTGELRIINLDTLQIEARTARIAELTHASPTQDGQAAIGVTKGGHFRIWQVPTRK